MVNTMRDMKRDLKRDLKKQTKQYTKARQGSSSSTRTKKRSNEMVQSWIESLPGGGGQKTNTSGGGGDDEQGQGQDHGQVVVNIDMPESTQVVAERERCVKSKSDAFSSLSILIPQTCTNISRNVRENNNNNTYTYTHIRMRFRNHLTFLPCWRVNELTNRFISLLSSRMTSSRCTRTK